jgi:hypothetical protein
MSPEAATYTFWSYLVYLAVSLSVTVWVARTLYRNGRIFLVDAFAGNEPLADSVNHLLVVGFYLINAGYVTRALRSGVRPDDLTSAVEHLSAKIGLVLIVLGVMHFFNLYVFSRIRRRGMLRSAPPPVAPSAHLAPGAASAAHMGGG